MHTTFHSLPMYLFDPASLLIIHIEATLMSHNLLQACKVTLRKPFMQILKKKVTSQSFFYRCHEVEGSWWSVGFVSTLTALALCVADKETHRRPLWLLIIPSPRGVYTQTLFLLPYNTNIGWLSTRKHSHGNPTFPWSGLFCSSPCQTHAHKHFLAN